MRISRDLAIQILKYCHKHKNFDFPFLVMCKEYTSEDNDFVEICSDEWKSIEDDDIYQTFELWDNLHTINNKSIALLSRGFIETITGETLFKEIELLSNNYHNYCKRKIRVEEKTEEYGLNEFINGKAEAYKECLDLIEKHN